MIIKNHFHSLHKKASLYSEKRVASIFVLGIAQGLPWVMIGSMLTLWLKQAGISRTEIGYAALIFSVYAINFLWAPLIDLTTPKFFSRLGRRQSWIVLCQLLMVLSCFAISTLAPEANGKHIVLLCLSIAILSATQDLAIDAYRIDSFAESEKSKISAAAGVITAGWWTGYAGIGALPLFLSDMGWEWSTLYMLLGLVVLGISIITSLLPQPRYSTETQKTSFFNEFLAKVNNITLRHKLTLILRIAIPLFVVVWAIAGSPGFDKAVTDRPFYIPSLILIIVGMIIYIGFFLAKVSTGSQHAVTPHGHSSALDTTIAWLLTALVAPLREFFSRSGVKLGLLILLFILLFKVGEAFLGRMSIVFYKELGFSNTQIATYSKLITWWLTVFFALVGGIINARLGLLKGLFISGIAMAGTNLLFSLMAIVGPNEALYAVTIVLDGFAAAWSTVAFVSLISLLSNHAFSATQYALMASLGSLGRTTLSSMSGQVVDLLNGNWAVFFICTTLMIIPSFIILWRLRHYLDSLHPAKPDEN